MRTQNEITNSWTSDLPLVSICCVVYNHSEFVHDALDGFLSQITDFGIEVLISDDASTDGSQEIIKSYQERYPKIIKPIFQLRNQFSLGIRPNIEFNLPRVSGEYIAFCDGDDFWSDPHKLQSQVDFLRLNGGFSACAHNTAVMNSERELNGYIVNSLTKDSFDVDDFTQGEVYFHSSSLLFRNNESTKKAIELIKLHNGDWFRLITFSMFGPVKYIDKVMSVYRVHGAGIWSLLDSEEQVTRNLRAIVSFNRILDYKFETNLLSLLVERVKGLDSVDGFYKVFRDVEPHDCSRVIFFYSKLDRERQIESAMLKADLGNLESELHSLQQQYSTLKLVHERATNKFYWKLLRKIKTLFLRFS